MKKILLPIFGLFLLASCGGGAKTEENQTEGAPVEATQSTVTEEGVEFTEQPNGDAVATENVEYTETEAAAQQQDSLPK